MKNLIFVILIMLTVFSLSAEERYYYKVDKQIKIDGEIKEILEAEYKKGKENFIELKIFDKSKKEEYLIQVAPIWFIENPFMKGEKISVWGSLVKDDKNERRMIAREIKRERMESIMILRDKRGFPMWRGMERHHKDHM